MKKTASAAKKLLLSTERVRSLDAASMRTVLGGAQISYANNTVSAACPNYSQPQEPPPCAASCTIGGFTTVRCVGTDAR